MVIDLGYVDAEPVAAPARRRPLWPPLTVLAVAALTLGGAAVPTPPLTETVTAVAGAGSSYAVVGDRLYLVRDDAARGEDPDRTLVALTLPAGEPLWATPYAPTGERIIRIDTAGPVVLVSGGETTGRIRRTDAYAAATGRPLWAVQEEVVVDAAAGTGYVSRADPPRLRVLDLATGAPLWTADFTDRFTFTAVGGPAPVAGRIPAREAPESEANAVGADTGGATVTAGEGGSVPLGDGRLAVVVRSGGIELRDARTGAIVTAADPLGPGTLPLATVSAGGGLVVYYAQRGGTGLAGFDPDSLALRWRASVDIDGGGLGRCLALVCVSSRGDVIALDPVTGRQRWRTADASYLVEARGQLIALGSVPGGLGPVHTVDPDTGDTVADLRGWRTGARGDPIVTRIPLGTPRTVIAQLGPPTGVLRPLGTAAEVLLSCQSGPVAVVCRTAAGELRIWALRDGR